jgi:hypothetical protein
MFKNGQSVYACNVKTIKFKNFRLIGILEDLILPRFLVFRPQILKI